MSLKDRTVKSVFWNGGGNIYRQLLSFLTLIVMARHLSPYDFGSYSIMMIFVGFMNIISTLGTTQAIIKLKKPSQELLSTVFFFNIITGATLCLVLFFLSWPIAAFFDDPNLTHLIQIISVLFIFSTLSSMQRSLLEKALRFSRVIKIESFAATLSSFSGILGAFSGLGVYSLLLMSLVNYLLLALCFWLSSHWRPSADFSLTCLKQVWSYSYNLVSFSIINYFSRQSDHLIIGKILGSSALGTYSIAYKILLYPLNNVSSVIIRVLFPALSEIQNDSYRFRNAYLRAIRYIALITFPLMAGLFVVADDFVMVAFGDKWLGLASLLMIFAPVGLVQSIVTTVGTIYMAKGTTNILFKIGLVNAVVTVFSFIIGAQFGIQGVAFGYAIANLVMLYPNLSYAWRQIDLDILEGGRKLMPFFNAAFLMALVVHYSTNLLETFIEAELGILILKVLLGAISYISILVILHRKSLITMLSALRSDSTGNS